MEADATDGVRSALDDKMRRDHEARVAKHHASSRVSEDDDEEKGEEGM